MGGKHYTFDGHEPIDGKRYYFNQDGEAKLTGFDKVKGKIYYYDDKGVMQTGWQEIDGKWYYFDESGAAKIGWFEVGGGYHFLITATLLIMLKKMVLFIQIPRLKLMGKPIILTAMDTKAISDTKSLFKRSS